MTVIIEKFDTKENGSEMSSLRYCLSFLQFSLKIELDSDKTKIRYKRQETKKN